MAKERQHAGTLHCLSVRRPEKNAPRREESPSPNCTCVRAPASFAGFERSGGRTRKLPLSIPTQLAAEKGPVCAEGTRRVWEGAASRGREQQSSQAAGRSRQERVAGERRAMARIGIQQGGTDVAPHRTSGRGFRSPSGEARHSIAAAHFLFGDAWQAKAGSKP